MLRREALPLYHQLRELLTEKIESGEWPPGHQLPTEMQICAEFRVSRATVRQAMQLLANQGLIEKRQGRGTFVGRPKVANNLMELFSPYRGMLQAPALPSQEIQSLKLVPAARHVAIHLRIPEGEDVYEIRRRVVVEEEPLLLVHSWLSARRFPGFDTHFPEQNAVIATLRRYYGVESVSQYKEVEITILDAAEAKQLEVDAGAPALLITYVTSLAGGDPFEYRTVTVRGDRCKYYVEQPEAEFII
jgi:GntR family transcriptional regulator